MNNQKKIDSTSSKPKFTMPEGFYAALSNAGKLGAAVSPPTVTSIASGTPEEGVNQSVVNTSQAVGNALTNDLHAGISSTPKTSDDATVRHVAPSDVTNAEFVSAIFGTLPEGFGAAVCSKSGDPTTGGWNASLALDVNQQCPSNRNNYVSGASFKTNAEGGFKARKDTTAAFYALVLDDVGTKVMPELLKGFKPSWAIETSPGNFQLGFILADPLTNPEEVAQLQNAVIAARLCDPGAIGMTRWVRLPKGINGKEKYRSESGEYFQCRMVRWRPKLHYTLAELVAGLRLNMQPASKHTTRLPSVGSDSRTTTAVPTIEIDPAAVARLPQLLDAIDPDCERPNWIRALMAVFHTTGGSDDGLAMVDAWSSKGKKYRGIRDIETQWRSFRSDVSNPVTIGTLIKMARNAGANVDDLMKGCDHFEYFDTEVVGAKTGKSCTEKTNNPLARFSLLGHTSQLESQMVEEKCIFGKLFLQGQANGIFSPPNMGKTALALHLSCMAISTGALDPKKLYYINMDDNGSGLVAKNKLADEFGFNMLADGHRGFELAHFNVAMEEMIANDTARGVVIILDTLKKFVNPMVKDDCRKFTKMARRFSMKGGTVIALAHVNKNRNANGRVVYAGTSDIVDDFDCAYALDVVSESTETNTKVVEFTNFKKRGSVALSAAYSYSVEPGLSYEGLILSIQEVDSEQLKPLKQASDALSDAAMICAIVKCISNGINTKMKLAEAAAEHVKASKRLALKVIEKYTGEDPAQHRWMYVVRDRGAKVYELLQPPSAPVYESVHPSPILPEPEGNSATPVSPSPQQANAVPEYRDAEGSVGVDPSLALHAAILEESIQLYGGGDTGSGVDTTDTY